MRMFLSRPRARQDGLSLVSLMVGLALALLCVVVAMQSVRVTVLNSREAAVSARGQSISASTLLQLEKLLPQAGWGLHGDEPTPGGQVNVDLVLLQAATLSADRLSGSPLTISGSVQSGNALVWASALQGTTRCHALLADAGTGLYLLGPQDCDNATTAVGATWSQIVTLIPPGASAAMHFEVGVASCWPFGGPLAQNSVQVRLLGLAQPMPATCLPNMRD